MNALDLIFLALIAIGAWRGYRSGLARQLLSTAGLFLAFVIGASVMGPVGSSVVEKLGFTERIAPIVGFIVVFTAVLGGVAGVGYLLKKTLEAMKLSSVDHLGGALISGFKAALSLSILLLITGYAPTPGGNPWLIGEETREASLLYDPIEAVAPETWRILEMITPGLQEALKEKFNNFEAVSPETTTV